MTRVESARCVDEAIKLGIDHVSNPPEPLKALFNQIEAEPLWLDQKQLKLASRTFLRSAMLGNWVLIQVALMGGYRYEGIIQPLLMSGRLTEYASKRMAETTIFVNEVTRTESLRRGAAGYEAALRVRLLHAHIRWHLIKKCERELTSIKEIEVNISITHT